MSAAHNVQIRKSKAGKLIQFAVQEPATRRAIRDGDGDPIIVSAYTAKSAKHLAKLRIDVPFVVAPA